MGNVRLGRSGVTSGERPTACREQIQSQIRHFERRNRFGYSLGRFDPRLADLLPDPDRTPGPEVEAPETDDE